MKNADYTFSPLKHTVYTSDEMLTRAREYNNEMRQRRSVRQFSDRPVPLEVMETIVSTAGTAPSGANKQPWTFCLISDPSLKTAIRKAAEKEEYENYHGRMNEEWLEDLAPFDTDWHKPFLEVAPWLIVLCKKVYNVEEGQRRQNYYVNESVGIAAGMLIAAIHHAGLVTLTHTPSPMNFLTNLLERPPQERAFLLLPVGYPAEDAVVPDIEKKSLEDIMVHYG